LDAILALPFSIDIAAFNRSTCLRRFNAGDIEGAAVKVETSFKSSRILTTQCFLQNFSSLHLNTQDKLSRFGISEIA
jgi:hypothetical protein